MPKATLRVREVILLRVTIELAPGEVADDIDVNDPRVREKCQDENVIEVEDRTLEVEELS